MAVMMRTMLDVADNSGARKLQMILPLGGSTGLSAGLGDVITARTKHDSVARRRLTTFEGPGFSIETARWYRWISCRRAGDHEFTRYRFLREGSAIGPPAIS